jgi:5-methyltetrahydrofolate--homocysteine methyltransferase
MFVIVGERINTSRKPILEAVEKRNISYIQKDVKNHVAAGANYIGVNAGARIGHEMEDMDWLLEVIQEVVTVPLCLDSPDPKVIEKALDLVKEPPMINSISLKRDRYEPMLSYLENRECNVVALCMDDSGMPTIARDVIDRAVRLVEGLEGIGIRRECIHIDPLIQPISNDGTKGVMAMEAVKGIIHELPGVHTICGLSNISFGLPQRKIINRTFLCLLTGAGLDGAIIGPLDDKIMAMLKTTLMLIGKDDYCEGYLKSIRAGQIVL